MGWMGRAALRTASLLVVLGALGVFEGPAIATSPAGPAITLHAAPANIHAGKSVTLAGHVTGAPPGSKVSLYRRPFPYKVAHLVATLTPNSMGAFSLKNAPRRNTLYVARISGTPTHATVKVGVFGGLKIKVKAL